MELKSLDQYRHNKELLACMKGYVRAKQEDGLLLMDIPIDNLHPDYIQYVADTCAFELGLEHETSVS